MIVLILTCFLIISSSAQSLNFGRCPDVTTVSSFDANNYAGVWYEYERSFPNPFEFAGKCSTANYTVTENGTITVINSQISEITGKQTSIKGAAVVDTAACGNSTGCAKLIVKFPTPILGEAKGKYWVLNTDYTSYSVVWSCTDYYLFHFSYAWILTRESSPSNSTVITARNVFADNNIGPIFMITTNQEDCW